MSHKRAIISNSQVEETKHTLPLNSAKGDTISLNDLLDRANQEVDFMSENDAMIYNDLDDSDVDLGGIKRRGKSVEGREREANRKIGALHKDWQGRNTNPQPSNSSTNKRVNLAKKYK